MHNPPRRRRRVILPLLAIVVAIWVIAGGIRPHVSATSTVLHVALVVRIPFLPPWPPATLLTTAATT